MILCWSVHSNTVNIDRESTCGPAKSTPFFQLWGKLGLQHECEHSARWRFRWSKNIRISRVEFHWLHNKRVEFIGIDIRAFRYRYSETVETIKSACIRAGTARAHGYACLHWSREHLWTSEERTLKDVWLDSHRGSSIDMMFRGKPHEWKMAR